MRQFTTQLILYILVTLLGAQTSKAAEYYKWTDDAGEVHFTDSKSNIPAKYRDQIETKDFKKQPGSTVKSQSNTSSPASSAQLSNRLLKLNRYTVPYRAYEGYARRIIIPVTFNDSITVPMAFDTGAPTLTISPKLAKKLGLLDTDEGLLRSAAGGIGGIVPAFETIIDKVSVGGAYTEFVPTTIVDSISSEFDGLLGMIFVANYKTNIDTSKNVIVFQETEPKRNMPAGHDERWWRNNYRRFADTRNRWKQVTEKLKIQSQNSADAQRTIQLAEKQYAEANKLFRKLERYASQHAVPKHWRKY